MMRILAVLAGCVVGILFIFMGEALSHALYPPPPQLDPNNIHQLAEIMAQTPVMALIIVLAGAFAGSFVGGIIASTISKGDKKAALLVGGVFTILGGINLIAIPHPLWFTICGLVVYLSGSYSGYFIHSKFKNHA